MMGINRKKLVQWIRMQQASAFDGATLYRLILRHAMGGNKASSVAEFDVSNPENSPEDIASLITEAANDDAEGLGGLQKYTVSSYFSDDPDHVRARFSFRLLVDEHDTGEVHDSEPATSAGLLAQMMRHNEAMMRVTVMSMSEIARIQTRQIERLASQNEDLTTKHLNMMEMMEEVMTAKDEREVRRMEVKNKLDNQAAIVDKIGLLLPAVVNRISGKNLLPSKTTPEQMMLDKFLESFSLEQMQGLGNVLKPEQMMIVMELYQAAMSRSEAAKKQLSANGQSGAAS